MMHNFRRDSAHVSHLIHDRIDSTRAGVDQASERIMRAIEDLPCAQGSVDDINLALSEALANAVVNGNHEDPAKHVDVCAICQGQDQFTLVITDEGGGFDPALVPDPTMMANLMSNHGRGLFLIRQLMDRMDFRLGGRQIVMTKIRQDRIGRLNL